MTTEIRAEYLTEKKYISEETKTNPKKFWKKVRQKTVLTESIPAIV